MKNKILTAVLSLVIAFGLWVYVISVVSPDSEITVNDIPVVLQGENILHERGLMVISNETPTIDLRLAGNRSDLTKLDKSNITVTVDVTKVDESGILEARYSVAFPGDIPNNAISIQSQEPDNVKLVVQERITKEVPVSVVISGSVPEGFEQDKETVDYPAIPIIGPKSVVDQITQAVVQVDLHDQKTTLQETLPVVLCDAEGSGVDTTLLKYDITEVTVTVPIVRVKEIPVLVNVIPGAGATEENTSIEINPSTIKVSGNESLLENLESVTLVEEIDLGQILSEEGEVRTISFVLPPEVTNETGDNEATVTITFPELMIQEFQIPAEQIELKNIPDGYNAEIVPEYITVRVRGLKTLVSEMDATGFKISLDLSGCAQGTVALNPTVGVILKYTDVAILSYTQNVPVLITEIPQPVQPASTESEDLSDIAAKPLT